MTAADIKAHIDPIRHEYADSRSLVLPALKFAQTEHGWLPPDALAAVAEATGSAEDNFSIAIPPPLQRDKPLSRTMRAA